MEKEERKNKAKINRGEMTEIGEKNDSLLLLFSKVL